ncbi:MAG: hypothetical protein CL927_00860 [Deltaproteobacteria bacterium]|nr:hypothetical protein [Deltaproteobacteria bacterium]HCH64477.1 hypothetical protein [Deltaproteobacteria bacterium]
MERWADAAHAGDGGPVLGFQHFEAVRRSLRRDDLQVLGAPAADHGSSRFPRLVPYGRAWSWLPMHTPRPLLVLSMLLSDGDRSRRPGSVSWKAKRAAVLDRLGFSDAYGTDYVPAPRPTEHGPASYRQSVCRSEQVEL